MLSPLLYGTSFGIVILGTLIIFGIVLRKKENMPHMTAMMIAMSMAMAASLVFGTILGILLPTQFALSTLYSMLFGIVVGYTIGIPICLIAAIDGLLAGLMGGMMGAMLGVMLVNDPDYPNIILFLNVVYIMVTILLIQLIREQSNVPLPSTKPSVSPKNLITLLPFLLLFLALAVQTTFSSVEPVENQQHHHEHHHHSSP